jgi:hypothetical protein
MWFDPGLDAAYQDGIAGGIADVGYRPVRVDFIGHGGQHNYIVWNSPTELRERVRQRIEAIIY